MGSTSLGKSQRHSSFICSVALRKQGSINKRLNGTSPKMAALKSNSNPASPSVNCQVVPESNSCRPKAGESRATLSTRILISESLVSTRKGSSEETKRTSDLRSPASCTDTPPTEKRLKYGMRTLSYNPDRAHPSSHLICVARLIRVPYAYEPTF